MKKSTTLLVGAFAVTMLAGCSKGEAPVNVEEISKGFKSSLEGTVSLNYETKYKVDIENGNSSTNTFKHDITETTAAEIDLTEGNLYLHIKKDAKDYDKTSMKEALVYKQDASYFYLTNFHKDPVKLASEEEAKTKIAELIKNTSFTFVGGVSLDSLVFKMNGDYENAEFLGGLGDDAYGTTEIKEAQKFAKNGETGLNVKESLDYMAYKTDMALSRFAGEKGSETPCLDIDVNVNKDGYVENYLAKMAARNVMSLGPTLNPTVKVDGTRKLTAEYGKTLTKLETIAHAETKVKIAIGDCRSKGTLKAFTGVIKDGAMVGKPTPITSESEVIVGQQLILMVAPAGENTLLAVTYAGSSLDKPNMKPFFVFNIEAGDNKVDANFNGDDVVNAPITKVAKLTPTVAEGVTVKYTTCAFNDWMNQSPVTDMNKVDATKWLCMKITAPAGKTLTVKVNDEVIAQPMGGFYCHSLKEGANTIEITIA